MVNVPEVDVTMGAPDTITWTGSLVPAGITTSAGAGVNIEPPLAVVAVTFSMVVVAVVVAVVVVLVVPDSLVMSSIHSGILPSGSIMFNISVPKEEHQNKIEYQTHV